CLQDPMQTRLDRVYAFTPARDPIDRAFAQTVAQWSIPKALPEALIEGFAWDLEGRQYRTIEDLHAYSARVAGSVGAMMSVVMGAPSRLAISRACDLGVAMQLTNIARDIGEDARAGRIYAPLDWFADAKLDPEDFLANPVFDDRIAGIAARLLSTADPLYERGLSGVECLSGRCRAGIKAAGLVYSEIGMEIRRNGYDSVTKRAIVTKQRKIELLAKAAIGGTEALSEAPPLAENRFLVDAVAKNPALANQEAYAFASPLWLLNLFGRLVAEDRAPIYGLVETLEQTDPAKCLDG
ncbi:MAG: phytoene/squalene synthase family protein, partial [Pseudomonadota bacterium]